MNGIVITKKILLYIEKNLDKDLNLDKIAEEFNYSKFYIEKIFKRYTGVTLYKYIRSRRLNEAARKLVQTQKPVIEIAFEAGYNSQQSFTQAFSYEYKYSPQRYRKMGIFVPKQSKIDMSVYVNCRLLLFEFVSRRRAA